MALTPDETAQLLSSIDILEAKVAALKAALQAGGGVVGIVDVITVAQFACGLVAGVTADVVS